MHRATSTAIRTCSRTLRDTSWSLNLQLARGGQTRLSSDQARPSESTTRDGKGQGTGTDGGQDGGAMSRRLAQMSDESLETGGRSAEKVVKEAWFDETLKRELEERIANASFRNEHPSAFAQAELPSSAGKE